MQERPSIDAASLRARFAAEIAAGRTVVLSAEEMADPHVRQCLPDLLDSLEREQGAAPAAPVQVPGYTMQADIGHGGMSTVWLARQDSLGRRVALKVPQGRISGDASRQKRLVQEAQAMARVSHPNIVGIHDIIPIGDSIAIAMDWIDGCTLQQLLHDLPKEHGKDDVPSIRAKLGTPDSVMPFEPTAVRFFVKTLRDVALAVQSVHEARLLHLDIKPSNILVRRDGTPLLADFGVVRDLDLKATHTRTFAGTPVYAAPEQLGRDDDAFGPHTDVYSLGITLYEALAREQPLKRLGLTEILHDVKGGRVAPLAQQAPVPADLANIVHKAIAPEPQLRYPTAAAFAEDLTAFLENRPVQARPLTRLQRMRRWVRNEKWKAGFAALLMLLLPTSLVLGGYLWWQMPALVEAEQRVRLAQANRLKQDALQAYLGGRCAVDQVVDLLQQAIECEPGDTARACLVSLLHEEADPALAETLRRQPVMVQRSLGMRLLAAKAEQRRHSFSVEEVRQLRNSQQVIDRYLLALDRFFLAEDARVEDAYDEARDCLVLASLVGDIDPTLLGLLAWTAIRDTKQTEFRAVSENIRGNWPDDPIALTWLALSIEPKDPTGAIAIGDELIRSHPTHPRGYEIKAEVNIRRQKNPDYDAALRVGEAATIAQAGSPYLDMLCRLAAAVKGDQAAAKASLEPTRSQYVTFGRRLRFLHMVEPADAVAACEAALTQPARPAKVSAVFNYATKHRNQDLANRAWQMWRDAFPDRRRLHLERIGQMLEIKNFEECARLGGEIVLSREGLGSPAEVMFIMFTSVREWTRLGDLAKRVLEHGPQKQHQIAHAYAGIAAARLGDRESAIIHFGAATAVHMETNWFANTLVELAWMQVDPEGLPGVANLASAAKAMREFDAMAERMPNGVPVGPWAFRVRAEIAFAEGDKTRAITMAQRGLRMKHPEIHAPDKVHDHLRAALVRYAQ